ncbi:MAG TPA: histidine phosphatase family protein [Flavisolibacter sp.]|nr:histidine phosphatase family protein [Flavisolibacter sp.]
MKNLILVRHAKSSWDQLGTDDFDRPLNERGKKDAPEMAARLKEKGLKIDLLLSSPAKRASKTAKYFAEEFGLKKDDIEFEKDLYGASPAVILKVLTDIRNKVQTVALFAHNPGITEFASSLTDVHIDNMPTCSVFAVQADTDDWQDFAKAQKRFLFFDYPKNKIPG